MYIHTYTNICIYFSIWQIHSEITKSIPIPPILIQYSRIHSSLLPFLLTTSFSNKKKPGSLYIIWYIYLFNQLLVCNKYHISAAIFACMEASHSTWILIPYNGLINMPGHTAHPFGLMLSWLLCSDVRALTPMLDCFHLWTLLTSLRLNTLYKLLTLPLPYM